MDENNREAAICGIGILSPIGNNPSEVLDSLRSKRDGIGEATKIDTHAFASNLLGEVRGYDYSDMTPRELEIYTDPYVRLALCAARRAFGDAGIALGERRGDIAFVLATCNAGMNSGEDIYKKFCGREDGEISRSKSFQYEFYALPKIFASAMNLDGEAWIFNTACSGSTAAMGFAEYLIESGRFDTVLVGGADAASLTNFAGFSAIKVVSSEKTAPFSTPVGMNLGEGAAFWILRELSSALKQGAKIYGKVIGSATGGDAHHPTQPDPRGDGAYRTLRDAASNAGVEISQMGCINAHGSGTSANDAAESRGIEKFTGTAALPVTSTKSYTGHCMGATGIIEATCQLLSMDDDFIPPTLRNVGRRPGCRTEAVSGEGVGGRYDCFISANYAFAGNNAAIVVSKTDFTAYHKKVKYNNSNRIVISGAGFVSSLGVGAREQLDALAADAVGIGKISRFASERFAGCVKLPNLRSFDRRIDFDGMNRISAYATIAAKTALDAASLKVSRDNSESIGIAVSVCRGADESAHMEAVLGRDDMRGDIGCFSNVTANSTAGWVSKALEIKGDNITLTCGPNSGLQSVAYAARRVSDGRARQIVAISSDEIYAREMEEYYQIGNLRDGDGERDFRMSFESPWKTVMGEGAAALVVEGRDSAIMRGVPILAEILSETSVMDVCEMLSPNVDADGAMRAAELALSRAGVKREDVELLVWAPRGDAQDKRIVDYCESRLPKAAMLCDSFNTGYMDTSSILHALACSLTLLADGKPLWRQRTGVAHLDNRAMPANPKLILCLAGSHAGNCHALLLRRGD